MSKDNHLFIAGCLNFILLGIAVSTGGIFGASLHDQFGKAAVAAPQLAQIFFVGSAVVIISAALTHHVFARSWVPKAASACTVLGAAVAAMAPQWEVLLLGWFLMGCANGGLGTWFNGEVARTRTGPALALLNGCWAIGAILGPLLVRQHLSAPMGAFWVIFGAGSLALLMTIGIQTAGSSETVQPIGEAPSHSAIPTGVFALAGMMALYVGIESTVFVFVVQFLISAREFTITRAAELSASMMFAFAVGRFLLGAFTTKLSPRRGVALSALLACVAGVLLTQPGLAQMGLMILGFAMGPIFPTLVAWVAMVTRQTHRGTAILTTGGVLAAAAIPPALTSTLVSKPGQLPWWVVGFFAVLTTAAILFVAGSRRNLQTTLD